MDNEKFFVGVRDSNELRKNVLESSRLIIQDLKRYEDFKAVKKDKIEKINKLKELVKEMKRLNSKLNLAIPKLEMEETQPKRALKSIETKAKPEPKNETKKVKTDLDRLEEELQKIEAKLAGIK